MRIHKRYWHKSYILVFNCTFARISMNSNEVNRLSNYDAAPRICYVSDLSSKLVLVADYAWWRHQMETFSPVPGEFPAQRPVTRSFDVLFDLPLNKRLSKQPWGWWFETPAWSLWRHRNGAHNVTLSSECGIVWYILHVEGSYKISSRMNITGILQMTFSISFEHVQVER